MNEVVSSAEVFYEIDGDKIKSSVTLYKDGVVGLEQDGNTIFIYPAEVKAIKEVTRRI
jgi:hypothetical protein